MDKEKEYVFLPTESSILIKRYKGNFVSEFQFWKDNKIKIR